MKRLGVALTVILFAPALALAHGGGLDSHGCHNDKKAGDYHCHKGPHSGASFKNQAAMLELDKKNAKVEKEKTAKEDKKKK